MTMKRLFIYLFLTFIVTTYLSAQIPSGYVQTVATVPSLANGTYGAAWTNLSSSPQLGLLGCVSTFQTTANGAIDSNGYFSTLLADTAQICPTPSTWTFTLTFACPGSASSGAFQVAVPVIGGGGTEDITSQITAALPANPCGGGSGGPVFYPSAVLNSIPFVLQAYPTVKLGNSGCTWSSGQIICTGIFSGTPSIVSPLSGVSFRSGLYIPNSPSFTLGATQGVTNIWSVMNPLHGGVYNGGGIIYSGVLSTILNRTQGTNQGFTCSIDTWGRGDNVCIYANAHGYGGGFYGLGGASIPALEFVETNLGTGFYTFQATVTGSPAPGATSISYIPTAAELANETSNPVSGNSAGARYLYNMSHVTNTGTVNLVSGASVNITGGPVWSSSSTTQCDSTIGIGVTCNPVGQMVKLGSTRDMYATASKSITILTIPSSSDTLTINGVVFTFVTSGATAYQVNIGGTTAATTTNLLTAINLQAYYGNTNTPDPALNIANYSVTGSTLNIGAVNGFNETFALSASVPGNFTLTGTTLGCDGDDVVINSLCTGNFYLVTGVGNTTLLYTDLAVDKVSLKHTTPPTSYMMVQSAYVSDVDTVAQKWTIAPNAGTLLPAWSNGDLLFQPPDWRVNFAGSNIIENKTFLSTKSFTDWAYRAASTGAGRVDSALEVYGAHVGGGFNSLVRPLHAHLIDAMDFTGSGGQGENVEHSFWYGPGSVFGGHFLDLTNITAKTALNTFGATFSVAPISMQTGQSICWSIYSGLDCTGVLQGLVFAQGGHTAPWFRLGTPGTPTSALDLAQWKDSTMRLIGNLDANGGNEGSSVVFNNNGTDIGAIGYDVNSPSSLCISLAGIATLVQGAPCTGAALKFNASTGVGTFTAAPVAPSFTSTVATGTAPLTVASTTLVANLHAATADSVSALGGITSTTYSNTVTMNYTTFATAPQAGLYMMCGFGQITTAGTGTGTWQLTAHFTSHGATVAPNLGPSIANATLNAFNEVSTPPCGISYADNGSNIQFGIAAAGTITTAPTISYTVSLQFLHP